MQAPSLPSPVRDIHFNTFRVGSFKRLVISIQLTLGNALLRTAHTCVSFLPPLQGGHLHSASWLLLVKFPSEFPSQIPSPPQKSAFYRSQWEQQGPNLPAIP